MQFSLKRFHDEFLARHARIKQDRIIERIWSKDHTVWRPDPDEITNRLGWLDIAERTLLELPRLKAFAARVRSEGFNYALLLGMGGSSLAPEVLRKTFGVGDPGIDLSILDSTDPGAVLYWSKRLNFKKTLFIVATKSGGTVETFSFFKYFYNQVARAVGQENAGNHFVAITDPGSGLVGTAEKYRFRETFLNDPEIGGRYSALSFFGLVPAALIGIDIDRLLKKAVDSAENARDPNSSAARLGTALGILALKGCDKLTILTSPALESFGDWVEQLIAESTGKEGKGILPVVGVPAGSLENYGEDRFFIGITVDGDLEVKEKLDVLNAAGHPVARIKLDNPYSLGGQFFDWEFATAVAGHVMDIQPFDQPNVESAKTLARKMVSEYHETGKLSEGNLSQPTAENVKRFLVGIQAGDYVSIQAYVPPAVETDTAIKQLQLAIRNLTGAAVTAGYGPRFLHSTGQLHKGDAGNGRFIQFVSGAVEDVAIPDEAGAPDSQMSFQVLKRSQALGDALALREASPPRKIIEFDTGHKPALVIAEIAAGIFGD